MRSLSPSLLTAKQVAEQCGVKPGTIYKWAKERKIPHVVLSIGNGKERQKECIRFRQSVVDDWIKERERPATGFTKWDLR